MMTIKCVRCGCIREINYSKAIVATLINDGWRGDSDMLYCPECASNKVMPAKTNATTIKAFKAYRKHWYQEHPAKKNLARNTLEWEANFRRQWDAARIEVLEQLEKKGGMNGGNGSEENDSTIHQREKFCTCQSE